LAAVSHPAVSAYGPSAFGGSAKRFFELTMTLARSEFKLRYFGSVLGYVWSLMRPLLFFGVLYFFFTKIFHVGHGVPHYGVYLLSSIVLWNYLAEATGTAVNCLIVREPLLRKIRFPRMVIPISVSLTATFNLAMNAIAVFVFALANGVSPTFRWLELIPIVGALVVFATGIAMLLSAAYIRARDVQPIWDVFLQAWFYCTPIMYLANKYGEEFGSGVQKVALINPPAMLFTQMGHALIGGPSFPSALTASGPGVVAISSSLIVGVFVFGGWFFTREAPKVAENL
jgi:ABC-2 type transport system permease protein